MVDGPDDAAWPEPPVNVRVQRRTGEIIPVDCVFDRFSDGVAVWIVQWSGDYLDFPAGDQLLIGVLPEKTSLVLTQVS